MTRFVFAMLLVSAVAVGCGKDEEPQTDVGTTDTVDMAAGDTAATDVAPRNAMNARPDMEETPDLATEDVGADTAVDMAQTLDMSGVGCAAGFAEHQEVAGAVVACEGAADALNQCDAADACAAGWHMCTASEYRTHFEAVEPAAADGASYWIASCIRDGAAAMSPTELVCADCTGTQTGGTVEVAYSCVNAITIDTDQLHVGVRVGSACTFAGVDMPGNDAYWNAQPSSALQAGAFCCID